MTSLEGITPAYLEIVASVASDDSRFLCLYTVNHLQEVDVRVALLHGAVAKHTLDAVLLLSVHTCVCVCVCVCVRVCACVWYQMCLLFSIAVHSG